MNVIARGLINFYSGKYPLAKTALLTWYKEFLKTKFTNFNELKAVYGSASIVAKSRIIFNIRGNEFRLITMVNFKQSAAYIIWFGAHKEYDTVNAETVEFDTNILN